MRPLFAVSLFALASTLAGPAMAQSEEAGVPILEAPYHLPVFTNQYVTVLKIFIPPGRNTGYHIHTEDSVSVNIVPADRTNQNLGSSELSRAERGQRGRATYSAYSNEGPRTHRVTNIGQTPFHNVSIIFRSRESGRFTPSLRANVPGYVQIMDNERVRGWRLVLEPGQSAATITQTAPGIRIVLDGGELVEGVPDTRNADGCSVAGNSIGRSPGSRAGSAILARRALRS